jgi:hypothetical protein
MSTFEPVEATHSTQSKWFLGLSERFREYTSKRDEVQKQKEITDTSAPVAPKSVGAASAARSPGSAAQLNIGQVVNAVVTPKTFWFGQEKGGLSDNTGILNEIGQSIAYMKQLVSEERAAQESAKPPKPEEDPQKRRTRA